MRFRIGSRRLTPVDVRRSQHEIAAGPQSAGHDTGVAGEADPSPLPAITEFGSFAHGSCLDCDWTGPGRRARAAARRDSERHGELGCDAEVGAPESVRLRSEAVGA